MLRWMKDFAVNPRKPFGKLLNHPISGAESVLFTSWHQIRKLAGLNLRENSSGKHKGQTRISKRGRARLRALLYQGVFHLVAVNAEFKLLHQHFKTRGDNPLKPKQSLIALCGKLIRILFTIGTRHVDYDPERALGPAYRQLTSQMVA